MCNGAEISLTEVEYKQYHSTLVDSYIKHIIWLPMQDSKILFVFQEIEGYR